MVKSQEPKQHSKAFTIPTCREFCASPQTRYVVEGACVPAVTPHSSTREKRRKTERQRDRERETERERRRRETRCPDIRWRGQTGFPALLSTSHLPPPGGQCCLLPSIHCTGYPTTELWHSSAAVASARDGNIPRAWKRIADSKAQQKHEVWKSLCRPKHATFFCRNASQHLPGCRTHFEPAPGSFVSFQDPFFPISSILCFSLILVLIVRRVAGSGLLPHRLQSVPRTDPLKPSIDSRLSAEESTTPPHLLFLHLAVGAHSLAPPGTSQNEIWLKQPASAATFRIVRPCASDPSTAPVAICNCYTAPARPLRSATQRNAAHCTAQPGHQQTVWSGPLFHTKYRSSLAGRKRDLPPAA